MELYFHKGFKKQYRRLSQRNQRQFDERLELFTQNPFDSLLNNHSLGGKYKNCRSINITGDLRAIYTTNKNLVIFLEIGTHSKLYD